MSNYLEAIFTIVLNIPLLFRLFKGGGEVVSRSDSKLGILVLITSGKNSPLRGSAGFDKCHIIAISKAINEFLERACTSACKNRKEKAPILSSAASIFKRAAVKRSRDELILRDAVVNFWASKSAGLNLQYSDLRVQEINSRDWTTQFVHLKSLEGNVVLTILRKDLTSEKAIFFTGVGISKSIETSCFNSFSEALIQVLMFENFGHTRILDAKSFSWVNSSLKDQSAQGDDSLIRSRNNIFNEVKMSGSWVSLVSSQNLSGVSKPNIYFSQNSFTSLYGNRPPNLSGECFFPNLKNILLQEGSCDL